MKDPARAGGWAGFDAASAGRPDAANVVPMIPSATDFISARRSIFPSWPNLAFVSCDDKAVVYGKLVGEPMTSGVKFRMRRAG
jgi:hypothetical protein